MPDGIDYDAVYDAIDPLDHDAVEANDPAVIPAPDEDTIEDRLTRIEETLEGMKEGVNTIGMMMNQVAEVFDGLMQKVQQGGIGSLLGGFMGGKNSD